METLKRGSRRLLIVGADSLTSLPASKVGVKANRSRGARDLEQSARDSLDSIWDSLRGVHEA